MSEAFIIRHGGSGIGKAFAVIHASYPAGSVCTCSNGEKTLKAKDTSGEWNFIVPSGGDWIITAVDGAKEDSKTVSVDEKKSYSVTLAYMFEIISSGKAIITPVLTNYSASTSGGAYVITALHKNDKYGGVSFKVPQEIHSGSHIIVTVSSGKGYNSVSQKQGFTGMTLRTRAVGLDDKTPQTSYTIAYVKFDFTSTDKNAGIKTGEYVIEVPEDVAEGSYICISTCWGYDFITSVSMSRLRIES